MQNIFRNIIIIGLGLVLCVAGTSKLFPLHDFIYQLTAYHLPLPLSFLKFCSIPLITLEIWLGLSLLLQVNLRIALHICQILLLVMIPITLWGTFNDAPSCGCYGNLIERKPWIATVEDIILLLLALYASNTLKNYSEPNTKSVLIRKAIVVITAVAFAIIGAKQLCADAI